MSDFFGIGAGMKACLHVYRTSARATGRTINLVNSLETGDRVIFASRDEARRVERMCLERGVKILIEVKDPKNFNFNGFRRNQRTVFDHSFVEMFHQQALENSVNLLDEITGLLSHERKESEQSKFERTKWRI